MSLKTLLIVALSCVEARFGQEHPAAIDEIAAVTSGGQPGQAATIAGGAISDLLAAANPCKKLQTGDNIVASLGTGADAVKAAQDFVQAEQNFNPFNQNVPVLCSDPTLPTTIALRGIMPLIDPAVGGSDIANQISSQSLAAPLPADGMSVAQIFATNGFSNFTTEDLTGVKGAAPGATSGSSTASSNSTTNAASSSTNSTSTAGSAGECPAAAPPAAAATTLSTAVVGAPPASTASATAGSSSALTGTAAQQAAAADPAIGTSAKTSLAGVDFGLCVPTVLFAGGLANRKATEFTFQAVDPKISAIQQEALNPNIITNRICDELTNQCQSNQAAKDVCAQAKTQISGLGTRDQSTADAWNQALGF